MDAESFDRLARRMGGGSSRRGMLEGASRRSLLQRLSALPLGVGFASLVAAADARKGKDTRNGRNGKNDEDHEVAADKNRAKRRNKQCQKKKARACEGRCGTVTVKCKKRNGKTKRTQVDCGSCACDPPCGRCATCTAARQCEPCDPCCDDVCCGQANATCHEGTGACCVPDSKAQTCNNACGQVVNNCGVSVDCGPCTCGGGCPECHICDEQTNDCVADPNQQGDACGEPGQVCQADGTCACEANSCPACRTCENTGFCAACDGCCADGQCVADCPACQSCSAGVCATCANCCDDDTCQAGDTWSQCGSGNAPCAQCAPGAICAASLQTCVSCALGGEQRGTYCEIRDNFARFQCAANCACGAHVGGGPGVCWNVSAIAYCLPSRPICEFAADCVIDGHGDFCVPLGDCDTGCMQTACVTRCGAGEDEGPHQLVMVE